LVSATFAGVDRVQERQAVGGLHDAEHELTGNASRLLVDAEGADVLADLAFAVDAHRGQVVEDHRQIAIDQRSGLLGQLHLDPLGMVHKRVRRSQQVLMRDGLRHCRHGHGLQPAQATQLARRIAEPVEDHGAHEGLDIELALARAQGTSEGAVEAEVLPQLMEGEDVTEALRRVMRDFRGGIFGPAKHPVEAVDQRIELCRREIFDSPEVRDHAMAHFPGVIAVALNHLKVTSSAGLSDLRIHAATISSQYYSKQ
jgi:hypothetical protein